MLLHFAWDWVVKGGPRFAATLAKLRQRRPEAVGLCVGGGDAARAAASELDLGDALRVVEPADDVGFFYAAADALLATSDAEGGGPPWAILEALSCGLPVIATDIAGHRVRNGPAALRTAPGGPDTLAAVTETVLARPPSERAAEAAAAHEWVADSRGLATSVRRTASLYDRALAGL